MNEDDGLLDLLKVGAAISTPGLTLFGFPIESWAYVMSITVGAFYLLEKVPLIIKAYKWIRERI